jgi:hypothetical protein
MNPKKTSQPAPATSLPPPTHEQIVQRAHRIWIEQGRPEGRDREHWIEAERQLRDPSGKRTSQDIESAGEVEADKRVDGLAPPPRDQRTPSGENL